MARDGFDLSKLDDFTDSLIQASKEANKVQEKFLRDQGSKLARKTKQRARVEINKTAVNRKKYTREAGHYHKSIKRGKVYKKDGAQQVRVYSGHQNCEMASSVAIRMVKTFWQPVLKHLCRSLRRTARR